MSCWRPKQNQQEGKGVVRESFWGSLTQTFKVQRKGKVEKKGETQAYLPLSTHIYMA